MTKYYWIRESGSGAYCEGNLPDGAYDEETCIFVEQKPSDIHQWNNSSKEWYTSIGHKRCCLRFGRDEELKRTDKFVLPDYNAKFTELQKEDIVVYRQELRDAPNHETIEELVMPDCPAFMK